MERAGQITADFPHRHRITSEDARIMAAKSWENRRKAKEQADKALEYVKHSTPQSERLAKQLVQIEDLMDGETDGDALQKLSAAHARLFNAWQVLTGTPNPGSRRVKSERLRGISPLSEPTEIVVSQPPEPPATTPPVA